MPSWQADRYSSMCSICLSDERGAAAAVVAELLDASLRGAHERELRGDEESVQGDQNGDAEQKQELGHLRPLPARPGWSPFSAYFEEDRRRSCGDAASVAASASASMRRASSKSPLGQPALAVRRDRHRHRVPGDLEVGVVVHLLGLRREPVHEVDRALEVAVVELLDDRVAVALPAVQARAAAPRSPRRSDVPSSSPCVSLHSYHPRPRCCSPSASATASSRSPTSVTTRPARSNSPTSRAASSPRASPAAEIDAAVRERTGRGEALYELDEDTLEELGVDLIVTQAVCEVCAVSFDDVRAVAERLPTQPQVISLDPSTLGEVLADVPRLAAGGRRRGGRARSSPRTPPRGSRRSSRRWRTRRARAWPRSSGSTRSTSAATGCRR